MANPGFPRRGNYYLANYSWKCIKNCQPFLSSFHHRTEIRGLNNFEFNMQQTILWFVCIVITENGISWIRVSDMFLRCYFCTTKKAQNTDHMTEGKKFIHQRNSPTKIILPQLYLRVQGMSRPLLFCCQKNEIWSTLIKKVSSLMKDNSRHFSHNVK